MKVATVSEKSWNSLTAQSSQATTSMLSQSRGSRGMPSWRVLSFQEL